MPIVVGVNTASSIDVGDQSYSINKVGSGSLDIDINLAGTGYPTLNASGALTIFPVVEVIAVHPVIRNGPGSIPVDVDLSASATDVGQSFATGDLPVDPSVSGTGVVTFKGSGSIPVDIALSGIGEADNLIGAFGDLEVGVDVSGSGDTQRNLTASGSLDVDVDLAGAGVDKLGAQASGALTLPEVELEGEYVEQRVVFFVASVYVAPSLNTPEVDVQPSHTIDGILVRRNSGDGT